MLYSYFFNMLKVGAPGATQVPQLLVYSPFSACQRKLANVRAFWYNEEKEDRQGKKHGTVATG